MSFRGAGTITGIIRGIIIGVDTGYITLLTHVSDFGDGNTFVTSDDEARITGLRKFAEDGMPCSFFIDEHITNMTGTKFFANAGDIDIHAEGYIDACSTDGVSWDNENEFELKGTLCLDD